MKKRTNKKTIKLLLIILISAFAGCAESEEESIYIPPETSVVDKQFNFHVVDKGVWRSSQPNPESIGRMKSHGLKSILNLRGDSSTDEWERRIADSLGIDYFNYPMDATQIQDSVYISKILAVISDSSNQPILVHCLGGKDRTGLMIGLYKKEILKLPLDEIEEEMIMYGHDADNYPEVINALREY